MLRLAGPATALTLLAPGASMPQPFDHLADRELALIRGHADALLGEATTPFIHSGHSDDLLY
jgi:hypothetical protein